MREQQQAPPYEDSGWEADGARPLCTGPHRYRLVVALDFERGYSNTYRCEHCRATRTISGPREKFARAKSERSMR